MPLLLERNAVLDVYADAAENKWVVPTFCTENLTTTEAILAAAKEYADEIGRSDIPVSIAITNQYDHRSQSVNYTHSRKWDIGLKLFMADIDVLVSDGSPYCKLNVMTHLDHTQWDIDKELLQWDMNQFSMIMFDASTLSFDENINKTSDFMEKHGKEIVVEGACDEIVDATEDKESQLTTASDAKKYLASTGVDYIVANLGTEHRASAAELKYHGDLARDIKKVTGNRLVLHGTSSVDPEQVRDLFNDGIAKVNIWTIFERDSSPVLLKNMLENASKIAGSKIATSLQSQGLLGSSIDTQNNATIDCYTTTYRQHIIFEKMKEIVKSYLKLWYV